MRGPCAVRGGRSNRRRLREELPRETSALLSDTAMTYLGAMCLGGIGRASTSDKTRPEDTWASRTVWIKSCASVSVYLGRYLVAYPTLHHDSSHSLLPSPSHTPLDVSSHQMRNTAPSTSDHRRGSAPARESSPHKPYMPGPHNQDIFYRQCERPCRTRNGLHRQPGDAMLCSCRCSPFGHRGETLAPPCHGPWLQA